LIKRTGDVLVVGHMPHLSRLLSFLIFRTCQHDVFAFGLCAAVCLEKIESGTFIIKWAGGPEQG
jgi:hypothetical protein